MFVWENVIFDQELGQNDKILYSTEDKIDEGAINSL